MRNAFLSLLAVVSAGLLHAQAPAQEPAAGLAPGQGLPAQSPAETSSLVQPPAQASEQAGPPALALEAATDRSIYLSNASNSVYVEARIGPVAVPAEAAAAVRNVALVLDRSGSMADEPIRALRQAVAATLGMLAPHDIVSVVLFGSEVETLVTAQRRDEIGDLDALLARIEPAGGAALYDALNQGAAQLRRKAGSAALNHLVLVTDGPATKGPRERDDFTRLAELFAREGITLSTVGLGGDCEEDLLVALARSGNGRFHYAASPGDLETELRAEFWLLRAPVAQDVVLTVEFGYGCAEIEPLGWAPATVDDRTVTYRFPALCAGQEVGVLVSAKLTTQGPAAKAATVRLRWRDVGTGTERTVSRRLSVFFDNDSRSSRKSVNPGVMRAAVGAVISEGMQHAIEELDKGDFRRAQRELRRARTEANYINYELNDEGIAARVRVLETYLNEVESRGLNLLDRKLLRSGLHNQFDIPQADEKDAAASR